MPIDTSKLFKSDERQRAKAIQDNPIDPHAEYVPEWQRDILDHLPPELQAAILKGKEKCRSKE